jgi:hypothetical protein
VGRGGEDPSPDRMAAATRHKSRRRGARQQDLPPSSPRKAREGVRQRGRRSEPFRPSRLSSIVAARCSLPLCWRARASRAMMPPRRNGRILPAEAASESRRSGGGSPSRTPPARPGAARRAAARAVAGSAARPPVGTCDRGAPIAPATAWYLARRARPSNSRTQWDLGTRGPGDVRPRPAADRVARPPKTWAA